MSQVMVGDKVQSVDNTGNVVYSEVLMFMDREPEERMRFITITGEDGREVTLTPSHLIYTGSPDCGQLECMEATYAGNVQTGHSIMVTRDSITVSMRVAKISVTKHTGVFAPLTRSGNIVVDSVLASCYAVIDSQSIAHTAFAPVRWYHSTVDMVRTLYSSDSTPRTLSTGVHWYPDMLYSLARYLMPGHLVL